METNYGVYHLADNPAQYQPVRTNNYRCICQGLEGKSTECPPILLGLR